MTEWYRIDNIDKVDSPALLIYLERIKENIAQAIRLVGDVARLRPHVKTHKSALVTRLMLEAGIRKFKCATIAEAEMLAQGKAPDVLLAYQPVGPKIARLLQLIEQYQQTNFSCLVDSADAAQVLGQEARARHITVNVLLDINIGMNRTGVLPQEAAALYSTSKEIRGINVVGLHGYDGHINDTDTDIRKQRTDEAYGWLAEVQEALQLAGLTTPIIVVGGSPTFALHAARPGVECSPGTFVYWDKSYSELFPDLPFLPAALVVCRVVSVINKQRLSLDLGHKAIAAENPLARRVFFLNAPNLQPVGHSEEHLMLTTDNAHEYKPGDILYGMPYHICPTCALYDGAWVIEGGKATLYDPVIARNRKIKV